MTEVDRKSQYNMHDLPSEILGMIFQHLDNLEYCLVNKFWKEQILKYYPLTIQLSKDPTLKYQNILQSDRQFSIFRFNFYNHYNEPPNLRENEKEVAEHIGPDIKKFETIRSYIKIEQFLILISEMENLEQLKVIATRLIYPHDPNDFIEPTENYRLKEKEIPQFSSLKSVILKDCSELFFKIVKKSRLHEVNVSLKRESLLQEFLSCQPDIRKIGNIIPFNKNIFQTVWNLKYLVELDLNLEKTDFEGFEYLQGVNLSLRKLTLLGNPDFMIGLKIILSIFPRITDLTFANNSMLNAGLIKFINEHHQLLTKIRFNSCTNDILSFVCLENLKFVEITEIQYFSQESWREFIENNPTIVEMVLKDPFITNEHFKFFVKSMRSLRILEIHHGPNLNRDILSIFFNEQCSSHLCLLKVLKLKNTLGEEGIEITPYDIERLKDAKKGLSLIIRKRI